MGNSGERTELETSVSNGDGPFIKERRGHALNLGSVESGASGGRSLGDVQEAAAPGRLRFREQLEDRDGATQTGRAALVRRQREACPSRLTVVFSDF